MGFRCSLDLDLVFRVWVFVGSFRCQVSRFRLFMLRLRPKVSRGSGLIGGRGVLRVMLPKPTVSADLRL